MRTDRELLQEAMTHLLNHSADWKYVTPRAFVKEARAALEPGFATIPHIVVKAAPPLCEDEGCDHAGKPHVCHDFAEAWKPFEKAGFRYGKGPLEGVKFGWQIAHGLTPEQARGGK